MKSQASATWRRPALFAAAGGLVFAFVLLVAAALPLRSQGTVASTDEQTRLLEVRRRQIQLRSARAELSRAEQLHGEGLISKTELERSEAAFEQAQLDYQSALLTLLSLPPRISVQRAVKFEGEDGRKYVRLILCNVTPTFDDERLKLLNDFEGSQSIPESLRTRDVRDVYVSLQDIGGHEAAEAEQRGTIIALPYEQHLDELPYGHAQTLTFQLLQDVDSVVVAAIYKDQRTMSQIRLEQAETDRAIEVTAIQISQEVDLGGEASYDLRLQRSTVDVRQYRLAALNLPPAVTASFLGSGSDARLSQLNFPAGVTQRDLRLRIQLPDRATERIALDQPLAFYAAVTEVGQSSFETDAMVSEAALEKSRAGYVLLELIPRGVGELEMSAPSLFGEVTTGEGFRTSATVANAGTRRLDNVTLSLDAPFGWRAEVEPGVIPALERGAEVRLNLLVEPPAGVLVGDYEVRLRAESFSPTQNVTAPEKTFRIRVNSSTSLLGIGLLLASLVAIVVGAVVFWIRLSRR